MAGVSGGDTVVIVGAGPIGLGCLQFAKAAGARVVMIDLSQSRLDFCEQQFGVLTILADADALQNLAQLTEDEFATVVIDATGHPGSMMRAVEIL